MQSHRCFTVLVLFLLAVTAVACAESVQAPAPVGPGAAMPDFTCDPDNGGISLPEGFCATVFADDLGVARHLAASDNGDVYVARRPMRRRAADGSIAVSSPGGLVGLRDSDGDGKADVQEDIAAVPGTGVAIHEGYLYYSSTTEIYRVALDPGQLVPSAEPELLVSGFPSQGQHATKPMTFDGNGNMYVTVGAPSNACQQEMRTPGSLGEDPCTQLELHAGIWRFDAARPGQMHPDDGYRFATGIRNGLALDWNASAGALYTLQHGRDSLGQLFPEYFTDERSAELPAEEMFRVGDGDDFGWPYCFYEPELMRKVLAPEYGGDGQTVGRCEDVAPTLAIFPAHWAPNDLIFYQGGTFAERYEGGAFVAFHGSWNRMPFPQQGYKVVFVPFSEGVPSGDYEVFADGFAQIDEIRTPGDAVHRPTGLAQGPDGSLYIADSRQGRVWRVRSVSDD